ncbi:MAG: hypothetical protein NTY65_03895, partial [Planctomycetota bacterium]|nr:hypothetical protein [Planctomycetota bacterium]
MIQGTYGGSPVQYTLDVDGESSVKITMAWTDPPGQANYGGLDDPTRALRNDLDITLVSKDTGEVFRPWILTRDRNAGVLGESVTPEDGARKAVAGETNTLDNIEQIVVDNLPAGRYTVVIDAAPLHMRGSETQDFALAMSSTATMEVTANAAGLTGDVIPVSFGQDDASYLVTGAEYIVGDLNDVYTSIPLEVVREGGELLLRHAATGQTVANLFVSGGINMDGEYLNDRLYLLPSGQSGLSLDTDAAAPGFQGTLRLQIESEVLVGGVPLAHEVIVTVQPGHSQTGGGAIVLGEAMEGVKVAQRLRYLGYTNLVGQPPSISNALLTGTTGGDSAAAALAALLAGSTQDALKFFKSVVAPGGDWQEITAALDDITVRRLNQPDAPMWTEMAELSTSGPFRNRYAASNLVT